MLPDLFHQTVLQREAIEALNIKSDGTYIDATFGRGGHTKTILNLLGLDGKLIAIDRDPQAIIVANELQSTDSRLKVAYATFSQIRELKETTHLANSVDGILFDLGVSSPQLDDANRGFSFLRDGPLDMRMDNHSGSTAEIWLNSVTQSELARVLKVYGEERFAPRIAKSIVAARAIERISTTSQLSQLVEKAIPKKFHSTNHFQM